ncbi:hypothetical protein D3C81_1716600 [compost metagenome]
MSLRISFSSPIRSPYGGFVIRQPKSPSGVILAAGSFLNGISLPSPALFAAAMAISIASPSISLPVIWSGISSRTASKASSRASCHSSSGMIGQFSELKERLSPGAMFQPIMAASIGMVPDPQHGSYRGRCGPQRLSRIKAAARVSFKGASVACLR